MLEIEQALIGSLFLNPGKMAETLGVVEPSHFGNDKARKSFLIMDAKFRQGEPIDPSLVAAEDISLVTFVAESTSLGGPFPLEYARKVREAAKKRRIRGSLSEILKGNDKAQDDLNKLMALYQSEMETGNKSPNIGSVLERVNARIEANRKRGSLGIKTGFSFLQEAYIDYGRGEIWVTGGPTSSGKTALMTQKVCNLLPLENCPSILIISTEMTEEQIVARILGNLTRVYPKRILAGNYYAGEQERVEISKTLLSEKPIRIYDNLFTIDEIEIAARKADLQGGVDLIFIDYVQNCIVPDVANLYQAQSILAKRFQKLAKDVSATVICLSQVSNEVSREGGKRLEYKNAGEWAAVSDISVMIEPNPKDKFQIAYRVLKNRHGKKLDRVLEFKSDFTRLVDAGPIIRNK